mgnify:CR=1 FL=1
MLRIAGRALLPSYSPCLALQLLPVGMLAFDGRCKTLDSAADGYVRGEACIVFLLGVEGSQAGSGVVIAGSAVNQDGRSSSLTAPNGPSQQQVRNDVHHGKTNANPTRQCQPKSPCKNSVLFAAGGEGGFAPR